MIRVTRLITKVVLLTCCVFALSAVAATAAEAATGDTFTAKGSGKIKFVGQIDYTLNGEVSGNDLVINIQSNKGAFKLQGTRI